MFGRRALIGGLDLFPGNRALEERLDLLFRILLWTWLLLGGSRTFEVGLDLLLCCLLRSGLPLGGSLVGQ